MATTEIIDIVDKENNIVGSSDVVTAHDKNGDLYLQKGNKYGKFDLSVGGHVQKGETYEDAAKREMFEELGLATPMNHIVTFLPQNARLNHYWAVFTATAPINWEFKETEEVASLEKFDLKKIKNMMQTQPALFTYGFINTMTEFIRVKNL